VRSTASLYGTADGGVLANETPLSIAIRRALSERPTLAEELFGEPRLPTLLQYDPLHRYFEADGAELLITGDGGVPLVRYRILDRGGVIPHARLLAALRAEGLEARDLLGDAPLRDMPFVYVFGRTGFALSLYGANVYPENVAPALEARDIAAEVTGKFVLELDRGADENVGLRLSVELAASAIPSERLALAVARAVRTEIERQNSEFSNYVPEGRRTPHVVLLPLGDPGYFPKGVKHRYTR
jgi:phenylacetate-CoA ligase